METPQRQDVFSEPTESTIEKAVENTKAPWVKPEIVDFKPVTVARGMAYRLGDGLSNLSA
jgi:hypothetical protein